MTSRDFCYWLQGFFELAAAPDGKTIIFSAQQLNIIQAHLNLVFEHEIDPSFGPKEVQDKLNTIHEQGKNKIPPYMEPSQDPKSMLIRC